MKKLLAVILSVALILSTCLFSTTVVSAATGDCNITFSDTAAHPGDTVSIPVYLKNNPGIAGIVLTLDLQDGLSYDKTEDVTNGTLFDGFFSDENVVFDSTNDVTSDGVLMTVDVKIDDDATPGDYSVTGILRTCFNAAFAGVNCDVIGGKITVFEGDLPIQSISLNETEIILQAGQTATLTPIFNPSGTTYRDVIWKTSRGSIASVDNGVVTAHKIGTAVITVKSTYIPQISEGGVGDPTETGLPFIPLGGEIVATCRVTVICDHADTTDTVENYLLPTDTQAGGYDDVTTCNICGERTVNHVNLPATGKHQNYGNITLEGDIGVNTYLDLTGYDLKSPKIVVKWVNVDGSEKVETYETLTTVGEGQYANYYKFTTTLAAHQMTDEISITLYDGNNIVNDFETDGVYYTSVKDMQEQYIEYFSTGAGKDDPKAEEAIQLCKSYLAYGSRAQLYFKNNVDDLADVNYPIDEQVAAVKASDINAERVVSEEKATGFKILSSSFLVKSKSSVRFYYELNGTNLSDYTFSATLDGKTAKVRTGNNTVSGEPYVEIYDIAAKDLNAETVIKIVNNNDSTVTTASYNAMCYAKNMINNSGDSTLVEMCKAMYLYSQAADAYFTEEEPDTPDIPDSPESSVDNF